MRAGRMSRKGRPGQAVGQTEVGAVSFTAALLRGGPRNIPFWVLPFQRLSANG
jgi:hypothetical protein